MISIFADMQYEDKSINNFAEVFAKITAIMSLIAVACFFETTCYGIFEHLLTAGSKDRGFFDIVFTYFGIVKTNELLYR